MKTVLVLLSSGGDFSMQMFSGVQKHARQAGWHLQTVEYAKADKGGYLLNRSPSGRDIGELLKFWNPDGCIVECGMAQELLRSVDFKKRPTVFLDRHPPAGKSDMVCVYSDAASIARYAARELLMSGYDDFAYVPYTEDFVWSRERGEEFSKLVKMNGKRMHVFRYPERQSRPESMVEMFSPWLQSLPKPCGVFAANDQVAEGVLLACSCCGIAVPDEMSVVGVDDETYICENCKPTISSVQRNFANAGAIAGETLAELMDAKGGRILSRTYPAAGLVRRESSRIIKGKDRRVAKAVEYIRCHACDGIGPQQVVAEMGISRTLADLSFRAALGHTILDEIHAVRLDHVKKLLAKEVAPSVIAGQCGYSSIVDLRRVFKARLGMTMGEYLASLA